MVEWSIAAVLKTVEARASGGSNPSLCAKSKHPKGCFCFWRRRTERTPVLSGGRATSEKRNGLSYAIWLASEDTLAKANLPLSAPKERNTFCLPFIWFRGGARKPVGGVRHGN